MLDINKKGKEILLLFNFYNFNNSFSKNILILLGIGDWGLGIGDWAQSPIPNPQSPIPHNK